MSDNATTVQSLNDLLAAHKRSLLLRLTDVAPFVSSVDAELAQTVRQMTREEAEHLDWLVAAIVERDGSPASALPDPRTASVHYVDLHYLLPRIVPDKRRLLTACKAAAKRTTDASAAGLMNRIAVRHQRHLEKLAAPAGIAV
jgi:hypothetical protein